MKIKASAFTTVCIVILMLWIILIISQFIPLQQYGIIPRTWQGLRGIIFAPFLHASVLHLAANSAGLFVLTWLMIKIEKWQMLIISIEIALLSGIGTWLIGRSAIHIGASSMIYGFIGYLLFLGIYSKKLTSILISISIFTIYGGALWGLMPRLGFVSWEGHLCGFISGILLVRLNYQKD